MTTSMSWVAGIVVIGDEILSGKVDDTNTAFLCRKLHEIGWTVGKVGGRQLSGTVYCMLRAIPAEVSD